MRKRIFIKNVLRLAGRAVATPVLDQPQIFIYMLYQKYNINLFQTFWPGRCCFYSFGELKFSQFIGKKLSKIQINFKKLGVAPERKNPTKEKIFVKRYTLYYLLN